MYKSTMILHEVKSILIMSSMIITLKESEHFGMVQLPYVAG